MSVKISEIRQEFNKIRDSMEKINRMLKIYEKESILENTIVDESQDVLKNTTHPKKLETLETLETFIVDIDFLERKMENLYFAVSHDDVSKCANVISTTVDDFSTFSKKVHSAKTGDILSLLKYETCDEIAVKRHNGGWVIKK
jgi:hypothetical protein